MKKQTEPEKKLTADRQTPKSVLESSLAGTWYPADKQAIRKQLEAFAEKAKPEHLDNVIALILPHAGYQYSGATATAGVGALGKRTYRRVIVMGPSHRWPMENIMSVPNVTHYATPLGEVPLDRDFIAKLEKHSFFQTILPAHQYEHSVQIELPLLQFSLKDDFRLVPVVVGQLDDKTIEKTAAVLKSLIDEETLVVASSDFTHYGPNFQYVPFRENVSEKLKELDMGAYEFIAKRNVAGFLKYCREKNNHICGNVPIAILLSMLPAGAGVNLIQYDTSGNVTGDYTNSVSYLAAAFTGEWSKGTQVIPDSIETTLSEEDKHQLLKLARASFTYYVNHGKTAAPEQLSVTVSEAMKQVRASFVTLKKDHALRGCIGEIYPSQPLFKSVLTNAVKSAVADHRFRPVGIEECAELTVEISALTPPRTVSGYQDIIIGKHGIVLSKSGQSAVFLPQVAPEQGWDVPQTLRQLSLKAGLPEDAWKENTQFMVFEAIVFGEKKP